MRVLLLSAYDAVSHRYWRECLQQGLDDWDWTVLTQAARHFSWRVRGNPLSWALEKREILEAEYDLLLATSMVDVATLRGLVPALARLPLVLYFHENQFAYPAGRGRHGALEAQMVSLYGALSADRVLFNSSYNRDSFLRGCEALLQRLPDQVPAGIPGLIETKSAVLPVPVRCRSRREPDPVTGDRRVLEILWNHRWEYDKGPEDLLKLVRMLGDRGLAYRLHLAGQQFREQPDAFAELRAELEHQGTLGQWGHVKEEARYSELLARCHVVLSTAHHDFQGLAMLEAVAAGCVPLAPNRLAYPEWFPGECLYDSPEQAVQILQDFADALGQGRTMPAVDIGSLFPERLLPGYRRLLRSQGASKVLS